MASSFPIENGFTSCQTLSYKFTSVHWIGASLLYDFCKATSLHSWNFIEETREKKRFLDRKFWILVNVASKIATLLVMWTNIQGTF